MVKATMPQPETSGPNWEQYRSKPPRFSKRDLLCHALQDAISYNADLAACHQADDPFLLWLNPLIEQMTALQAKLYPEAATDA